MSQITPSAAHVFHSLSFRGGPVRFSMDEVGRIVYIPTEPTEMTIVGADAVPELSVRLPANSRVWVVGNVVHFPTGASAGHEQL